MNVFLQIICSLFCVTLIHELGHYVAAKAYGLKVSELAIFYGSLVSITMGETKFSIGIIPMGGFTQVPGIYKLQRPGRIIIYSAGIVLNVLTFTCTLFYFNIPFVKMIGIFSLIIAIINIIPADPFDGKKIFG